MNNIVKNVAIVVQWDAVDGAINYIVHWTNETRHIVPTATSYTINGLNFDTVYTVTFIVAYTSSRRQRFTTSISLSTACTISATVTVSTTPVTIVSTANPSSTTTIALINFSTTTTAITTTTATCTAETTIAADETSKFSNIPNMISTYVYVVSN